MSPYCVLCQKVFRTDAALSQHQENAPAHKQTHCVPCDKTFPSAEALAQHVRDLPAHQHNKAASSFPSCTLCDRTFVNDDAFNAHVQNSPKHKNGNGGRDVSAINNPAGTYYPQTPLPAAAAAAAPPASPLQTTTSALSSTTSTATRRSIPCSRCARTFATPDALAQHMRDTPFHAYYMRLPPGLASGDDSGYFSAAPASVTPAEAAGTRCDSLLGDDDLDHDDGADGVAVEMPVAGGADRREEKSGVEEGEKHRRKDGGIVEKGVARALLEELDAMEKGDEEDVKMLVRLLLRKLRLV